MSRERRGFADEKVIERRHCQVHQDPGDEIQLIDMDAAQVPVCTNANLTNLNSRANDNTDSGGGGGYGVTEGELASAGAVGTFACTYAWASNKAYLSFAIRPSP